jgi:hypothetical protein
MKEQKLDSNEDKLHGEIILSSTVEKEAVFYAGANQLKTDTKHEVGGTLNKDEIDRNNSLRVITGTLARSLEKIKIYSPEEWLQMGITEFVPNELLREWANPAETPHFLEAEFHRTAKYFFDKDNAAPKSLEK